MVFEKAGTYAYGAGPTYPPGDILPNPGMYLSLDNASNAVATSFIGIGIR